MRHGNAKRKPRAARRILQIAQAFRIRRRKIGCCGHDVGELCDRPRNLESEPGHCFMQPRFQDRRAEGRSRSRALYHTPQMLYVAVLAAEGCGQGHWRRYETGVLAGEKGPNEIAIGLRDEPDAIADLEARAQHAPRESDRMLAQKRIGQRLDQGALA
jgi:hypothetical protein